MPFFTFNRKVHAYMKRKAGKLTVVDDEDIGPFSYFWSFWELSRILLAGTQWCSR